MNIKTYKSEFAKHATQEMEQIFESRYCRLRSAAASGADALHGEINRIRQGIDSAYRGADTPDSVMIELVALYHMLRTLSFLWKTNSDGKPVYIFSPAAMRIADTESWIVRNEIYESFGSLKAGSIMLPGVKCEGYDGSCPRNFWTEAGNMP